MEAAVRKPIRVAKSREKHIAFGNAHYLPEAVLTTSDKDVVTGVHGDAAQEERRVLVQNVNKWNGSEDSISAGQDHSECRPRS